MSKLMLTRFNNKTENENKRWKQNNNYEGCIYNSSVCIKEIIPLMVTIYVVEMNNDINKIIGFGKIVNKIYTDKKYKIYDDKNYNRYTYKGVNRVDIKDLNYKEDIKLEENIKKLEIRLFKGKGHLKRGHGITQVPNEVEKEYLELIEKLFTFTT